MSERKRTALEDKWAERDEGREEDSAPEASQAESGEGADALAQARAEIARLQEHVQRRQAELVNFRRRTERERVERREAERAAVLAELLPVVDDFERAVAAGEAEGSFETYREGVELILKAFHEQLVRLGLTRVEPVGELFDPNVHEAVERQVTSEVAEGHVAAVYKPGYQLGERLVRPAMVAVAVAPGEDGADRRAEES